MAPHQDVLRRISLAMPNVEALNLLASSQASAPSAPPSWRRFQPYTQRINPRLLAKLYMLPVILLLVLIISYLLLDIRIHIGFHRPCAESNSTSSSSKSSRVDDFYVVDLKNESLLDDNTWRGYTHYLARIEGLKMSPAETTQRLKVAGRGPYGFVHFSSYRMGPNAMAVVGFGARMLRDSAAWNLTRCWWEDADNTTMHGVAKVLYAEEHGYLTYDTIILQCSLPKATKTTGGMLWATIDSEEIMLYREAWGQEHFVHTPSPATFPHVMTVCTPSLWAPVEPRAMVEFVEYHRHLGIGHFVMYDAGAFDERLAKAMEDYLAAGILEVVPFREVRKFHIGWEGTLLAYHDCLYRSRMNSRWVMVSNWDEYIYVPAPETLLTLLTSYDGYPWITHGTLVWSLKFCRPGPPIYGSERWSYNDGKIPFLIERMVFHWPHIVCHGRPEGVDPRICPSNAGERKYMCDPRQVDTVRLYEVAISAKGGENLSYDKIHHRKYSYIYDEGNFTSTACKAVYTDDETVDWWARDYEQAKYTKWLRESAYPDIH